MRRLAAALAVLVALACAGRAVADPATACAPFKADWARGGAVPPLCQTYFAKTAPRAAPRAEVHKPPPPKRTPTPKTTPPPAPATAPTAPPSVAPAVQATPARQAVPLPAPPPGPPPTTGVWVGSFPPATLSYGGPPFCAYTLAISQAHFSITIRQAGQVTASLQFLAVESDPPSCPYKTIPAQTHSYYGVGGRDDDGSVNIDIQPDPGNQPHASGSFSGKIGPDGRITGHLIILRDQQKPPLAWTLEVPLVTLTPSQ
ncbi:MAG TPA: hypothetical protein VGL58_03505 [Caulobacteraceae bacterium]|jgi:hypothetical protein